MLSNSLILTLSDDSALAKPASSAILLIASAMASAFLTGTGEDGTQWKIGVTMRARRTDPPLEFRRFRRVTAIAGMLTGK